MARAYGSTSSLAWLCRSPDAGSHGPYTRNPYSWPAVTPAMCPCQTPYSGPSSAIRRSRQPPGATPFDAGLIRHSSTAVACEANTATSAPPAVRWTPSRNGRAAAGIAVIVGHCCPSFENAQPLRLGCHVCGHDGRNTRQGIASAAARRGRHLRRVIVGLGGVAVSVFAVFFIYQVVHQALARIADERGAARALAYLPIVVVIAMFC